MTATTTTASTIDVFAEITCPFAYVGLRHVVEHVAELGVPVDIVVRAWPLEWVNGTGLAFDGVDTKAAVLREQLGVDVFNGLRADTWPTTTIPALALAAAAYAVDTPTGLAVSLDLRDALFERGLDIADPATLAEIASTHGVDVDPAGDPDRDPDRDPDLAVRADYDDGQARGVKGSPHYFVADDDFFCPALDLSRDAENHLIARFDPDGLAQFLASLGLGSGSGSGSDDN